MLGICRSCRADVEKKIGGREDAHIFVTVWIYEREFEWKL